jgi:hypothetical protein
MRELEEQQSRASSSASWTIAANAMRTWLLPKFWNEAAWGIGAISFVVGLSTKSDVQQEDGYAFLSWISELKSYADCWTFGRLVNECNKGRGWWRSRASGYGRFYNDCCSVETAAWAEEEVVLEVWVAEPRAGLLVVPAACGGEGGGGAQRAAIFNLGAPGWRPAGLLGANAKGRAAIRHDGVSKVAGYFEIGGVLRDEEAERAGGESAVRVRRGGDGVSVSRVL